MIRFTTSFNTGRMYTEEGQRIAVYLFEHEGCKVWAMRDFDRGIDYCFEFIPASSERDLRDYVMTCYDFDRNKVSASAWKVSMLAREAMLACPKPENFPLYQYTEYLR